MRATFFSFALLCIFFCSVVPAQAAALTDAQIQAVLNLLSSFGVEQATITNVNAVLHGSSSASSAAGAGAVQLVRNLSKGDRGEDVLALQRFLIAQGFLAADSATGYFGALTEAAVQRYQTQHAVVSSGTPATTGWGAVGPKTRSTILAQIAAESSASHSSSTSENSTSPAKTSEAPDQTPAQNTNPSNNNVELPATNNPVQPADPAPPSPAIVFAGDSRTDPRGDGGGEGPSKTWPYLLLHQYITSWSDMPTKNAAVNGYKTSDLLAQFQNNVFTHAPSDTASYFFVWVGVNDLSAGLDAQTIYTNLRLIWSNARALGYKVVAFTSGPTCGTGISTFTTRMNQLDALITGSAGLYDYLIDPASVLADPCQDINHLAFRDGVHPTAASNALIAGKVQYTLFPATAPQAPFVLVNGKSSLTISPGEVYTVVWSSQNATNCTISWVPSPGATTPGGSTPVADNTSGSASGSFVGTYTLLCKGTDGNSISKSATVTQAQ